MRPPLFALSALDKRFGARVLFEQAALQFEAGHGYVVTGANGSGKTTLLRMIAGLEGAQQGTLAFRDAQATVYEYPEAWRREIVYVHQQPYLFHSTIEKNLEYGLARRGIDADQRRIRVRDALEWAGLSDRRELPPHKLSGGEAQRVALARAKLLDPALLLLDEPTANLDGEARQQVLELVTALCLADHTVVIASHDPEIMRLAILDRMVLAGGRIRME